MSQINDRMGELVDGVEHIDLDSTSIGDVGAPGAFTRMNSDSSDGADAGSEGVANLDDMQSLLPDTAPSTSTDVIVHPTVTSSSDTTDATSTTYGSYSRVGYYGGSGSSYYYNDTKSDTGFVGLRNQGATCYMNSLLQTLYMTPEFRSALYQWQYRPEKDGKAETCMPFQLQKLFAQLQTSDMRAVETEDLTRSFGWDSADSFEQHDVQELCRVLFDALEHAVAGTEQSDLINDLYQGEMEDYVQCKECHNDSARTDKYLDVPLVIRGFGATESVKSVEEALASFLEPELLNEDNQYYCEKCAKKTDATKGLRFTKFPYLLTCQLKRFDFDYDTMRRIKLDDKVTFPFAIDMSQYLGHGKVARQASLRRMQMEGNQGEDALERADSDPLGADASAAGAAADPAEGAEAQEGWYELFAVLIHSGSAIGGHYYAYIKSFETKKWYSFNDSTVAEISLDEVKKAFGEDEAPAPASYSAGYPSTYGSSYYNVKPYRSSQSAYMLMYRRVNKTRNMNVVPDTAVPAAVKEQIKVEAEIKKKEQEAVKLRVYGPADNSAALKKEVTVSEKNTLAEAMELVWKETIGAVAEGEEAPVYDPSLCRLREYVFHKDMAGLPYGEDKLDKTLQELRVYSGSAVYLETRMPDETFPEYHPNHMTSKIFHLNEETKQLNPVKALSYDRDLTWGEFMDLLSTTFNIPRNQVLVVKENTSYMYQTAASEELAYPDNFLVRQCRVYDGDKLYVEDCGPETRDSLCAEIIKKQRNQIELFYNLPATPEKFDQKISIDKTLPLSELKEKIAEAVKLTAEEFKIYRMGYNMQTELTRMSETVQMNHLLSSAKVLVELGKPLLEGERRFKFFLFTLNSEDKMFEHVFDHVVRDDIPVPEVKKELAAKLKEVKDIDVPWDRLRLREMFSDSPCTIFYDSDTLKQNSALTYREQLALQILDEPEPKQNKTVVPLVQLWKPSEFKLGERVEICVESAMTTEEFKAVLGKHFGIPDENVSLAISYNALEILEIPMLNWDPAISSWYADKASTLDGSPLYLRDGKYVVVKDKREAEKVLTTEERAALEKESKAKSKYTYSTVTTSTWSRKEKALKIYSQEEKEERSEESGVKINTGT